MVIQCVEDLETPGSGKVFPITCKGFKEHIVVKPHNVRIVATAEKKIPQAFHHVFEVIFKNKFINSYMTVFSVTLLQRLYSVPEKSFTHCFRTESEGCRLKTQNVVASENPFAFH